MDAVVPAAGEGSRLGSLTAEQPKPLVEVGNKPLLEHALDALAPAEPEQYVVVVGRYGEQIIDRLGTQYRNRSVEYVRQEEPLGLADAVSHAEPVVGGEFLVCNGDNVLSTGLETLAENHRTAGTMLVETVSRERAKMTGVVVTDDHGHVRHVVEKPDDPPGTLVSAGAYVFSPVVFDACRAIEPSPSGEYELADAINWLVEQDLTVRTHVYSGRRVNVNRPSDIERAASVLGGR